MRLLLVELGRFRSRRAIAVILLVAAALAALMVASTAYGTRPVDAAEQAAAEDLHRQELAAFELEYDRCLEDPVAYYGPGSTASGCESARPQLAWFLPRPELDLAAEVENRGALLLVLLAGASILVAATFSGADWTSGSLSNQLLFVPRRLRLWAAKAVAVVIGVTLAAGAVVAGFWAGLWLVAESRGLSTSADTWSLVLGTSGRGLGLVAGVALGSFALTMLLRHTVGTLGLLFGYAVAGEGLAASLPFDRMSQWSLSQNVLAWLQDGVEVFDDSICGDAAGACNPVYVLTLAHAATYLGVLLLLATVVSLAAFRLRDIP
jgi:hypothetical protein